MSKQLARALNGCSLEKELRRPGVRGFSQPLFSRFQAACKRTVVLYSRCDLITKALASLLSGFIEVLSTLT